MSQKLSAAESSALAGATSGLNWKRRDVGHPEAMTFAGPHGAGSPRTAASGSMTASAPARDQADLARELRAIRFAEHRLRKPRGAEHVAGVYVHGFFEDAAVLQSRFGAQAASLDTVFDGVKADFTERYFASACCKASQGKCRAVPLPRSLRRVYACEPKFLGACDVQKNPGGL